MSIPTIRNQPFEVPEFDFEDLIVVQRACLALDGVVSIMRKVGLRTDGRCLIAAGLATELRVLVNSESIGNERDTVRLIADGEAQVQRASAGARKKHAAADKAVDDRFDGIETPLDTPSLDTSFHDHEMNVED